MGKSIYIDNIDQVMKALTKIGKGNGQEIIVEARKGLNKVVADMIPAFKAATPKDTGALRGSLKKRSRTSKGITRVQMVWDQPEGNTYGSYVNFAKNGSGYRKISNLYKAYKWRMDQTSREAIRKAMKTVFEKHGFTVK